VFQINRAHHGEKHGSDLSTNVTPLTPHQA